MKKTFSKIYAPALAALSAVFLAVPQVTHAAGFLDALTSTTSFVTGMLTSFIEVLLLPLLAGVMFLAGKLMDAAIVFSLHTAYIFSLSPAINLGWVIVRDIANIFFIFILIYISLKTIVSGTGFGTKQMLTKVIIAALLINFTLFIAKAGIDISNIFGNWLYGGVQNTLVANSSDPQNPVSLSGLIATRMGILGFWTATPNANGTGAGNTALTDPSQGVIGRLLRVAIVVIVIYVFLNIAILFIGRSITLLFLLVFSPVAFMSDVLPQIADQTKDWWKQYWACLIFPIAFLLMLYISLQFINSLGSLNLNLAGNDVEIFGMGVKLSQYFQYFIIIFLLKGTLTAAEEYSPKIGKMMQGAAQQLGQLAIGGVAGGAAFMGRRIIGQYAAGVAQNANLQDMAAGKVGNSATSRFLNQIRGQANIAIANTAAKSSFDVRGISTLKNITGVDLGKAGGKDGYKGMVKDREEAEKKYAEGFGDTPEGVERRMAYAEDRRRSILTNIMVGSKARGKIADKIKGEAGTAFNKAQTEKTKGDTQAIKNEIIGEQMAQETLERSTQLEDNPEIDKVLREEAYRADTLLENSRKNPKNKLTNNRYDRSKETDPAKIAQLDREFNEATKTMTDAERSKLTDPKNEKVKEAADLESYVKEYKKRLSDAESDDDIKTKKEKIAAIKKYIGEERVGKAPTGWGKQTALDGTSTFTDKGAIDRVLKEELAKAEEAQKEAEKDPDAKLFHNRAKSALLENVVATHGVYSQKGQEATQEQINLDREFEEATRSMVDADKQKFSDAANQKYKDVAAFQKNVRQYKDNLNAVINETDLEAKRAKIETAKKFMKDKTVAKSLDGLNKKETYAYEKLGSGLNQKLAEAKTKFERTKREQESIDGKGSGKKPVTGDTSVQEKKDDGDEEDEH